MSALLERLRRMVSGYGFPVHVSVVNFDDDYAHGWNDAVDACRHALNAAVKYGEECEDNEMPDPPDDWYGGSR